jgi:Ca2+-binding RTX toxin-like protein
VADFTGGSNNDIFTGGADNDTADGAAGNDKLSGNVGNDILGGDTGADTLDGGDGDDILFSGARSPYFGYPYDMGSTLPDRGTEVDTLRGGVGEDYLHAGYGDNVDGGADGYNGDSLYISFQGASSGVIADFRLGTLTIGGGVITGIEGVRWVEGSNYDDQINVETTSSHYGFSDVFGMGGNDHLWADYKTWTLDGGDGDDVVDGRSSGYLHGVYGGAGNDTLYTNPNGSGEADGGSGNDIIYAHGTIHGGSGNDKIFVQTTYYRGGVYGDEGNDDISASSDGSYIAGGSGADTLRGGSGQDYLNSGGFVPDTYYEPEWDMGQERDVLTGAGGDDRLVGGYGDTLDGGSGIDTLRYSLGGLGAGVSFSTAGIVSGQPFSLGGGTIRDVETLTHLRGTDFADNLVIATQSSLLTVEAGAGNDVITSNASSIALNGGLGNDLFISGIAGDTFDGGEGIDTVDYRNASAAVTITLAEAGATGAGAGGDSLVNVENVTGTARDDRLTGNGNANVLSGEGGNDLLDGRAGADTMSGGLGNDTFIVDNSGDRVIDTGGANDSVTSSASFQLSNSYQIEKLTLTGNAAINAGGNMFNNVLIGNGAANVLNGGAGADSMSGGNGNDTYYVDNTGDTVFENSATGGVDTVSSSVNFAMGGQLLETLVLTGSAAISGWGNGNSNTITGNGAANMIVGYGGADLISGGAGDDRLYGGNGLDELRGGAGADGFYFDTAPHSGNIDRLVDFSAPADTIFLDRSVFTGLSANGTLVAGAFHAGSSAHDADDRIVYNSATGSIFYDADGLGGTAAVLFARVDPGTILTASDFSAYLP